LSSQEARCASEQGAIALGVGGGCAGLPEVAFGVCRPIHQMLDERCPVVDRRIGWSSDGRALVSPTTGLLAWWGLHRQLGLMAPASS
jgi:hypothetical protein